MQIQFSKQNMFLDKSFICFMRCVSRTDENHVEQVLGGLGREALYFWVRNYTDFVLCSFLSMINSCVSFLTCSWTEFKLNNFVSLVYI